MSNFKRSGSRGRRGSARGLDEMGNSSSFFDASGRNKRAAQKTAQLCRQVFRAVSLALGECGDEALRELTVVDVLPAPDASRLMVRVAVSASADPLAPHEVLARLAEAGGFLRRAVAAAITRKRAPELMFAFVGGTGEVGA
jgi:ribosome-binding factor A